MAARQFGVLALIASSFISNAALAASSLKQSGPLAWCVNQANEFSPDLAIGGCTTLIQSGRYNRKNLAIIFYDRGTAYLDGKKDYDRAIADYDQAITLDSKYVFAYSNRGKAYQIGKKDYDRAIADYGRAIKLDPKNATAYYNRGSAYQIGKKIYDRAIADYDRAITLDPKNAIAYVGRGNAYQDGKKDYDRAIAD